MKISQEAANVVLEIAAMNAVETLANLGAPIPNHLEAFEKYGKEIPGYQDLLDLRDRQKHKSLICAAINKPFNVFMGYINELNQHALSIGTDSEWGRFAYEEQCHNRRLPKIKNTDERRRVASEGFSRFSAKNKGRMEQMKQQDLEKGRDLIGKIISAVNT